MPEPAEPTTDALASRRSAVVNLALVGGFAIAFAGARLLARTIHGVPGHSTALWLPVLIAARGRIGWPGSGAGVAVGGSLLAMPAGPTGHDTVGILAACAVIESLAIGVRGWRRPLALMACGVLANAAKLFVRIIPVVTVGLSANVSLHSPAAVIGFHIGFGALGGLIGWLAVRQAPPGARP